MAKKRAKKPPEEATQPPPTTSAEEGFIQAILADPDDDAHRLVYADWFGENGQPERAEFMRLQIARARLSRRDPARWTAGQRERTLEEAHRKDWLARLPESMRYKWIV